MPRFGVAQYTAHVVENAPFGLSVVKVHASDADSGSYGAVRYRFSARQKQQTQFEINSESGQIAVGISSQSLHLRMCLFRWAWVSWIVRRRPTIDCLSRAVTVRSDVMLSLLLSSSTTSMTMHRFDGDLKTFSHNHHADNRHLFLACDRARRRANRACSADAQCVRSRWRGQRW